MNPLLALMLLFRADTGEVQQFGHVDGFPHKATNEVERVITQDELEWLKDNMPARVTASNTLEPIGQSHVYQFGTAKEVPFVVLQDLSDTNKFYGFYSYEGALVGGILDHASPRDPVAISNRLAAAKARHDSVKGEIGQASPQELVLAAERANNARLNDAFRILARRVPTASNALQAVIWTPQKMRSNIVERLP